MSPFIISRPLDAKLLSYCPVSWLWDFGSLSSGTHLDTPYRDYEYPNTSLQCSKPAGFFPLQDIRGFNAIEQCSALFMQVWNGHRISGTPKAKLF